MNELIHWDSFRQSGNEPLAPRDPKLLIALGIDDSHSMLISKASVEVRSGLKHFHTFVETHLRLAEATEIATYKFSWGTTVDQVHPYEPLVNWRPRAIEGSSGASPIYEMHIRLVGDQYARMEEVERTLDQECRTGITIFFTDGEPTDPEYREKAIQATKFAMDKGIDILLVGCGPDADLAMLHEIAQPHMPPVLMKEIKSFGVFFERFFDALRRKSVSQVGQQIEFRPLGDQGPTLFLRG